VLIDNISEEKIQSFIKKKCIAASFSFLATFLEYPLDISLGEFPVAMTCEIKHKHVADHKFLRPTEKINDVSRVTCRAGEIQAHIRDFIPEVTTLISIFHNGIFFDLYK